MISLALAALITASASPAPLIVPTLPPISTARELPYPASGTPQPGLVSTRQDPTVPEMITLDQAVSIAIARVPALREARFNVEYERATIDSALAGTRTSILVSGSSTWSRSQQTLTSSGPGDSTSNSISLNLSRLIFDGGQTRAKIAAAVATTGSYEATYRRAAQQVAYNVATAYYDVLSAERTVAAYLEVLREDVVSENLVRAQIAAGTAAGADLAGTQYTTAQARTALVRAQGTERTARVTFATTLGLDADTAVLPYDDTAELTQPEPQITIPSYAEALATAYANRPDLRGAQLDIVSAQELLRQAQRGRSPSVSSTASKGLSSFDVSGGSFRNNASLGLSVSIPIYDQGLYRANVTAAQATLGRLSAAQRGTTLTIQRDVRDALLSVISAQSTLDQARAEYTSANRSLRQTQSQYKAGVTTLPSLVQAQTALAQALTDIVNAIYSLRQAQAALRYAVGSDA